MHRAGGAECNSAETDIQGGQSNCPEKEENKSDDYVKLDKLYQETDELYQALKHWRKEQADQEKLPAFCIFSNAVLDGICAKRPQSLEALGEIKGLGKKKIEKYGEYLLEIVKQNA